MHVLNPDLNQSIHIDDLNETWYDMLADGQMLQDNLFMSFKSQIQQTVNIAFFGVIGDATG